MIALLSRIFLRGLLAGLPVVLSMYVLVWFFNLIERMMRDLFVWAIPSVADVPGLGILLGCLGILILGLATSWPMFTRVFQLIELPFKNVPLVRSVYSAFKDLMHYFGKDGARESSVVVITPPGLDVQIVGLLTRDNLDDLPEPIDRKAKVAVFIPMSYALGGYTVFVPRAWIRKTDMRVEVAMRSALTAWIKNPSRV